MFLTDEADQASNLNSTSIFSKATRLLDSRSPITCFTASSYSEQGEGKVAAAIAAFLIPA